jgi:hypothetical protein
MRIAAESTIAACEQALRELAASDQLESLQLPKNIRYLAGGAEVALTQVIVSWAQSKPGACLETYLTADDQVTDFVRRLSGLVAGLSATHAVGRSGMSILADLQQSALSRLERLQGDRPKIGYRGSSVEIVCADHLGRGTPYLLYLPTRSDEPQLRPRENFRDLAQWLLRRTIPREYRPLFDAEASDAIGGMLFEIFKNTEDHALVDASGDLLDVSIRAIKTNHIAATPESLERVVESFPPLATFSTSLRPPRDAAQTHLFELSVLDSGPGFAPTWTKRPLHLLSIDEEERAVRECFGRGSAKGESRFGEGLPHVLRLLRRQQGFLRLRTGRLSLYADFSAQAGGNDGAYLSRYAPEHAAELAPVAGSLLTILIPMRR